LGLQQREGFAMKIYWSLRSIPELADLPPAEGRRLWRECWGKVLRHWQVWLMFLLLWSGILGALVVSAWLALAVGLGWPLAVILVGGVWGGAFGFLLDQVSIPLARPYLRQAREAGRARG
jgi:hypothetical protein